jgi:hypothetical protein
MWTLTIILLLASGDLHVIAAPVDYSLSGVVCRAKAQDVWQIERVGVTVVSATCARGRDV